MDNNNLNATPVQETVTETPVQAAEPINTTYTYEDSTVEEGGKGLSIASLILGIVAVLCGCTCGCSNLIFGVLAIIFAAVAKKKQQEGPNTVGLILGIVGLVLGLISTIVWCILIFSGVIANNF